MQNNCSITQTMNNSPIIYLPINKIPNVFRHIISSIPGIFEKMANIYGLENCKIILIETYPCNINDEKASKEGHYIKTLECVNKVVPKQTRQEYRDINKDKIKTYRDETKEHSKEYRDGRKDIKKMNDKLYNEVNHDRIKENRKAYYEANSMKINEANKINYEKNKVSINEARKKCITCECGRQFRIDNVVRHNKSIVHIKYIETLN